jgi:hypothetical protein
MCEILQAVAIALLLCAIGMLWVLHSAGGILQKQDDRDDT